MSTTKTCPSCGAEAPASERFCANCGSRLPEAQAEVSPTIQLGQSTPSPLPGDVGMRLPPNMGSAPPQRKGLPVWAIILLVLAGLCALVCVGGFFVMNFLGQQALQTASTTIAQVAETLTVLPTVRSSPETGDSPVEVAPTRDIVLSLPTKGPASGVGGVIGGVTGQSQTSEAASSGPAPSDLLASATQIFREEFANNRNGWLVGKVNDIETDKLEDGVFKVIWSGKGSTYEPYVEATLSNFIVDVDCKAEKGGSDAGCGIIFSENTDVGYYKFSFYEDYYSLSAVKTDKSAPALLEGNPSESVKLGDWNHLRVIKKGDQISIYLNDTALGTITDSTYNSGHIGVSTSSYTEKGGVEVWFDNFTIWELPG